MKRTSAAGVTVVLAAAAAMKFVALLSHGMQYLLLWSAPYTTEEATANDLRQGIVTSVTAVVVLTSLVVLFVWLFRAKKQAVALGMTGGEYSPGLTVGCFFIPLANLVMPFDAVRELWRASRNPRDWKEQPSSALVGWWWALWLANAIVAMAGRFITNTGTGLEAAKFATLWLSGSAVCGIASTALTIVLVQRIARQLRASEAVPPLPVEMPGEQTTAASTGVPCPPPLPVD